MFLFKRFFDNAYSDEYRILILPQKLEVRFRAGIIIGTIDDQLPYKTIIYAFLM